MIADFTVTSCIVPKLDREITFFCGPAMRQLRRGSAAYPGAVEAVKIFLDDYVKAETELLKQLQAEWRHHWTGTKHHRAVSRLPRPPAAKIAMHNSRILLNLQS